MRQLPITVRTTYEGLAIEARKGAFAKPYQSHILCQHLFYELQDKVGELLTPTLLEEVSWRVESEQLEAVLYGDLWQDSQGVWHYPRV